MGNGPVRSSARTRKAILDAARASFATIGFDRTTMRGIATAAGCDPAMIVQYFGNKQTLFQKAVELPLDQLQAPDIAAPNELEAVIASFIESWDRDLTFVGLLRGSATNEEAAETMRSFFKDRVHDRLAEWTGGSGEQASMLGAALIGLAWARYVLRLDHFVDSPPNVVAARFATLLDGKDGID